MTAPVARRGFNQEALEELIARRDEPEWMRQRRLDAWKTYQATPMPTRQDEEWRRTDLRRLKLDEFETTTTASAIPILRFTTPPAAQALPACSCDAQCSGRAGCQTGSWPSMACRNLLNAMFRPQITAATWRPR